MKAILDTILFIWQLPQNIAAGLVFLIYKKKIYHQIYYKGKIIFWLKNSNFGVSLGNYIFLDDLSSKHSMPHEYGHCVQSIIFGPLYLIVIGISSAVFCNLWDRWFHKTWSPNERYEWYYGAEKGRWPEGAYKCKWHKITADGLGEVNRF